MAAPKTRRAIIVSRIFSPEPSAASIRLGALARELSDRNVAVTVLTTRYADDESVVEPPLTVKRWPVKRDANGYVRGYLSYLSFDIPLALRLLVERKPDFVIVEPPPTTGLVVRVVCALRSIPYFSYAPDILSDAMRTIGSSSLATRVVRWLETRVHRGARLVLSVGTAVTDRLGALGVRDNVVTVGNGIDTSLFGLDGETETEASPYFVYAGNASEVHGALIFLDAFKLVAPRHPEVTMIFIGYGSDFDEIRRRTVSFPENQVRVLTRVPPALLAPWLRGAVASLASVRPESAYDYAVPTKMYASLACGTPVVFAGSDVTAQVIRHNRLGWATRYDVSDVAHTLGVALATTTDRSEREALAAWVQAEASMETVARTAADAIDAEMAQG